MPRRKIVKVTGRERFRRTIETWGTEAERLMAQATTRNTLEMRETARQMAPYETGALRESLRAEFNEKRTQGAVGTDLRYGRFQELGSRGRPGRKFLLASVEIQTPKYLDDVRREVVVAARRAVGR